MITPTQLREALGWLSDLPNRPDIDPQSEDGRAWLARLMAELKDVEAQGHDLTGACRQYARKHGVFYPSPGQIATLVVEYRLAVNRRERESEWREQVSDGRAIEGTAWARNSETGEFVRGTMEGFRHRNQLEFHERVVDLVRRGHPGPGPGQSETLVAAVLREEREEDEARARGEVYRKPRYGPNGIPTEAAGLLPIGGGLR